MKDSIRMEGIRKEYLILEEEGWSSAKKREVYAILWNQNRELMIGR